MTAIEPLEPTKHAMPEYSICGKEVLHEGEHLADCISEDVALTVQAALILVLELELALTKMMPITMGVWMIKQMRNGYVYSNQLGSDLNFRDTVTDCISDILEKELYYDARPAAHTPPT